MTHTTPKLPPEIIDPGVLRVVGDAAIRGYTVARITPRGNVLKLDAPDGARYWLVYLMAVGEHVGTFRSATCYQVADPEAFQENGEHEEDERLWKARSLEGFYGDLVAYVSRTVVA